jgi:hypothetical protein
MAEKLKLVYKGRGEFPLPKISGGVELGHIQIHNPSLIFY